MTLDEFQKLDELAQIDRIMDCTCIGGRDEGVCKVLLYQVDNFYVEIYFDKKRRYITRFFAFDQTDRLAPYLAKIPIPAEIS